MYSNLSAPVNALTNGHAVDFGTGEGLDDLKRLGLVVEEVVVGAEEKETAYAVCLV